MKKFVSLALALTMVLALAVPAMTAPSGFINGTVATIDKNGYNSFDGTEITSNNSVKQFNNFRFVADNKTLNAWYIDVTDEINGALEVAYKAGSAYYVVTFDIDGPGKYFIADSKGSAGANMAKIGAFVEADDRPWILNVYVHWEIPQVSGNIYEQHKVILAMEASGVFDFTMHLTNGYGDIPYYIQTDMHDRVILTSSRYLPIPANKIVDFKFDPASGVFEFDGYIYTWGLDWVDQSDHHLNDTFDGLYYISEFDSEEAMFYFKMTREPIQ